MEPSRRSGGMRHLLPFEVELCETLGLSKEEYFYFEQLSQAYDGKRPEGYELIPDVDNALTVAIISLVVGVAGTAAAILLAPKPQAPQLQQQTPVAPQQQQEQLAPIQTENITGATRFTSNVGFDSIQQLASLGETIPLVFANRIGNVGGIRVKTLLLWSQLLSQSIGQELAVVLLLSAGELAARPDFEGLAIGDQTLKNYTKARLAAYFKPNGERIKNIDKYGEGLLPEPSSQGSNWQDVFTVFDDKDNRFKPWFCGTRSPSTQTQFGCYSPIVNATPFRLPYELVMIPRASGTNPAIAAQSELKKNKLDRDYSTRAAFTSTSVSGSDTLLTYVITGGEVDEDKYDPWGVDDIHAAVEDRRIIADDQIQLSGLYMAGSAQAVCIATSTPNIWELNTEKSYTFRIEEDGYYEVFSDPTLLINDPNNNDKLITPNPTWGPVLQRLSIATIANNRACDATEIGLKSTVWKQISGFPNVNSVPDPGTIGLYERNNGSISLGSVNRYVRRISFFRLQIRLLGTGNDAWTTLNNDRLFAVEGNTPSPKYNYIRVYHPKNQYEFRFVPVPGSEVVREWINEKVYFLGGGNRTGFSANDYTVVFNGYLKQITTSLTTNPDWTLGQAPPPSVGAVQDISPLSVGRLPDAGDDVLFNEELPASGGSGTGCYIQAILYSNGYVEFSIDQGGTGYENGETITLNVRRRTFEFTVKTDAEIDAQLVLNLHDAVADIYKYDAENSSHTSGPEHAVVYVNEIIKQEEPGPEYTKLALIGLRLASSTEWSTFAQLSAYVQKGVLVERLIDDNGNPTTSLVAPTNNFAEIAYAVLTNTEWGAGKFIGKEAVDRDRMTLAARYCRANGFTWDGVLGSAVNLRNFIFENAGYCLLDFTILGGKFSLYPTATYNSSYVISNSVPVQIKALFTDGNIKDLSVTWLGPEERRLFKAVIKYREEKLNGFPEERMLSIRLKDAEGGSETDPEEEFDLTSFCTQRNQALKFAKMALRLRQLVDHSVTFQTTPAAALNLAPGQHFRLVSECTHTSRFANGVITPDGVIVSAEGLANGAYNIIYWQPGTTEVKQTRITVSNGYCENVDVRGTVYTLANSTTTSRVYKVETLAMGEEGFVEITASHEPVTDGLTMETLNWDSGFELEEG